MPGLASNLLSVYQMTHTRSPNKFIFFPDEFYITKISSGRVVSKGVVNHAQKVYMFSHFLPYSNPSTLLIHANEASKLWHEIFGHLNYKYLSDLSEKRDGHRVTKDKIFQRSLSTLHPRKTPRA